MSLHRWLFRTLWFIALCLPLPSWSGQEWLAPHLQGHPLAGQRWSHHDPVRDAETDLIGDLRRADFLLLGEVHGNPDHHRLQQILVEAMTDLEPALVFEIFDLEDQSAIDAYRAEGGRDADVLAERAGVSGRQWPWDEYRGLVQHALDHDLPIIAGNLSGGAALAVAREGFQVLDENPAALGLDEPLPGPALSALTRRILEGHCGYLPESRAAGMVKAQRARDAYMARRMASVTGRPVILIAGSGHARLDHGVPLYLQRQVPERMVLSLAFVEVREGSASITEYEPASPLAHHWVWFTPRLRITDPCDDFREQLERMRSG
ncbi:ChaN family lipoprotein [Ectothiorhodospira lacustris]|uniref:ChaN family lipoprotein n=1 Tax=Ectothiorhodospira lacustris TaxID=2899127 RepID=UPI001EE82F09|nr:ChaN family lipoprotein [Ectothiorhodospira lacustris]MCG5500863.1 ChaN family lipoprotein [Ectothiorhodospira lacustris]MCG5511403.1 ChaN family lipoprotein [Ectothiorhodospira lacustris]MCG5523196.1 ChaN family lipoprotein [Ectothiorhodospira lacustris]